MTRKIRAAALLIGATIVLGGCATVLNGVNQPLDFQSDPNGATINLPDARTCQTPCTFEMRRGNDTMVTFNLVGYQPVTVFIQSRTGGGVAGNLLAGGIIGGVVDASNGASNRLYPSPVSIRMVREGETGDAVLLDKDGAVISTVAEYNLSVEEDVRKGMQEQGLTPSTPETN